MLMLLYFLLVSQYHVNDVWHLLIVDKSLRKHVGIIARHAHESFIVSEAHCNAVVAPYAIRNTAETSQQCRPYYFTLYVNSGGVSVNMCCVELIYSNADIYDIADRMFVPSGILR